MTANRCAEVAGWGVRRWPAGLGAMVVSLCLAAAAAGAVARAQIVSTNLPGGETRDLVVQLEQRLKEARAELGAVARGGPVTSTNLPPGATFAEAEEFQLLASSLVRTYQEHIDQLTRLEEARVRLSEVEQRIKTWTGFPEPGPHSILFVDELRDSIRVLEAKIAADTTTRDVVGALSDDANAARARADERLRLIAERLEVVKGGAEATRLTWERGAEELRVRLLLAKTALHDTRRQIVEVTLSLERQELAFVRRQLTMASQQVRFSSEDLRGMLDRLAAERRAVEGEIATAEDSLARAQRELAGAREALRRGLEASAGREEAGGRGGGVARLQAQVDVQAARVETETIRLMGLRRLADASADERGLWLLRHATFHEPDRKRLQEGYEQLDRLARLIESVRPHFRQQLEVVSRLIGEQQSRMQAGEGGGADGLLARELLEAYQQREALANRTLRGLDRLESLATHWRESLDDARRRLPLTARVRDLFSNLSTFGGRLWSFELFTAEDTITVDGQRITGRRAVTVGKVVMAILILVVGYWVATVVSRLLERVAQRRFKVEAAQAALIRRWVRVMLVLGLVVFSLVSVKIPLTIFAFLGGALAIGLGFGTQNLLKNFISGIIILFERPFRVGDVLDIDGRRGTVMSIGIRSSVLRLFDGTETLIPNSALLENNLTNWTYTDRKVRFSIAVGVAYGTDTRRVSALLMEAAERHGLVERDPAPQVFFQEFGESALNFELRYWVDVVRHNAAQVASDLRHMINGSLLENGIGIPFPQRDVHLETGRPLRVELVRPTGPTAGA